MYQNLGIKMDNGHQMKSRLETAFNECINWILIFLEFFAEKHDASLHHNSLFKGKSPEVPFHGITLSYSYFEVI